MDEPFEWPGLEDPNGTIVPDAVLDYLMPRLSGAEFKVLMYIIRRTFGWKKRADDISLGQLTSGITRRDGTVLDGGTGLSKNGTIQALKRLLALGIIVAQHHDSAKRGHEPTTYALRFREPLVLSEDKGGAETGQALVQPLHPQPIEVQPTTGKARTPRDASRRPRDHFEGIAQR